MKKLITLAMLAVLSISMVACTANAPEEDGKNNTSSATSSSEASSSEAEDEIKTLKDRTGTDIEVKDEYTKIISFAPSLTEMLVDLGYGDKIVARTTVDMTQGVSADVITFDMMAPDYEALMALEPDLIISTELTAAGASDPFVDFKNTDCTIANVPTAPSIADIYLDIEFLGTLLNKEEEATEMANKLKTTIEKYQDMAKDINDKKSVYFEISPAPYMYSTGKNSYLHEMIEIVGGTNAFSDVDGWFSVTDEALVTANPDVIFTNVNYTENATEEVLAREGWDAVKAVTNKEVYYIDNMSSSLPNHNITKALDEMAKALYPEVYNK